MNETRVHVTDASPYSARTLNLVLIGSPDTPQTVYDFLVAGMKDVGINLTAHRAQCNSAPCAGGVARSQMYNSVFWDLDMELPNQNDANPAFLPVLRMSCLPSNAGFRFAPVDGTNGVRPPVADTAGNGGGTFPFGNTPCINAANTISQAVYGDFDNIYAPASNNAATQDAAQNAAANQMRILVNQNETNVVVPVLGQFRIYAMKAGMALANVHPSNTSQRWTGLTAP